MTVAIEKSEPIRLGATAPASWETYSAERLGDIGPFWEALEGKTCSPMQQYIWTDACRASLPINGELLVVAVKTGLKSGAIAPLVRLYGGTRRLEHLGVKYIHEPADFLYSDAAALKMLASTLVELGSPLFLERLPADSPTIVAIQDAFQGRGKVFLRPGKPYPRIALNEDWEEPGSQLNSGRRSDLRRAIRNAEKMGLLRYEVLSPTPGELAPLLEEAFEVEAANWKGREGSAVARDTLRGEFYRRYAAAASEAGMLRLCFMRVGGRAIAMQYAIECGGSFWLLKIGYREEFARCSPGMLLIAETIRYAASRGLNSYEFLGTAASWTRIWTKDECASVSLRAYPTNVRGVAALAVDAVQSARNRLVHRLRRDK